MGTFCVHLCAGARELVQETRPRSEEEREREKGKRARTLSISRKSFFSAFLAFFATRSASRVVESFEAVLLSFESGEIDGECEEVQAFGCSVGGSTAAARERLPIQLESG